MDRIALTLSSGEKLFIKKGNKIYEIIKENKLKGYEETLIVKFNGKLTELSYRIQEPGILEPVSNLNKISINTYIRTLQFIFIKAVYDLFPNAILEIEHTLSKGIYGEIYKEPKLNEEDIEKIKDKMNEIIEKDYKINKVILDKDEAIEIFRSYGLEDKCRILKYSRDSKIELYELGGRYDYFYGPMAFSTGVIKVFDLMHYSPGFILMPPKENNPKEVIEFIEQKKLAKIFTEAEDWARILQIKDIGALNHKVANKEIVDMVRIAEALHEKKVAYIADMIKDRETVKVVLIAGPSSSGKTTFTRRLAIQLRANGLIPVPISLDDYFLNRENTPRDENGDYDFESIYALDLELFNDNLRDLLKGKEVKVPQFNFFTGSRSWHEKPLIIPENGIMLIEGIHGLNEMLTPSISKENKFKIYISALTQLNLDNHNRISTTDVRIIRRIVRDYLSRGYRAEDTLKMWPSIRRGEEKNIFVFQEESDVMFNSNLIYELCVLKKYAEPELRKISEDSPVYYEALRLRSFLGLIKDLDGDLVPDNSILREFIGGSCFYKY
ncbi:threonine--tRNA ligase [Clostridium homopropionicum DSM 5847]|uniref:Threonine--tRNA ligase n=1 Tax=Clostridium homopropionicum DSM 5847 TaxID=1121318 RepID=A0A0L6ZCS5_9CLOT|nr:nucleoside kinase [Clostridium homopropionicum]KOA20771.1 threonine--tRNA ligase [Clostridium homopropionicum DSM 5847]SFF89532.1 uridine kinase [Clostridium homopropionicum]